ncbi:Bacteriophage Gp15 protein [Niallia circulans]|uniref:Gp15 family bacteriophage protein n=2 Tax=Niallia circulans TaxID=1397 RepID=UPI00077C4282|nr:Gp15 family bacteriophage protein [Niallia circulans]MED3839709.1 Gp15 family bacteriophage protein [Niallia circulans]MED4241194.1 Gp15 family bacteriophage protein [Niallia circulans]MED4247855.1 Gp15 family bacteriophage protein [Niallia circulans]SPU10963.1 Bacteriophage Gp15 protein [Niallia circulans]
MFSLARKLQNSIDYNGVTYELKLAFDNVLLVFDVLKDDNIDDLFKVDVVMDLLLTQPHELEDEQMVELYTLIMETVILQGKKQEVKRDLAGNVIEEDEDDKKLYSLEEDAQYIYASFLYDYQIDLIDQQGKMHWFKFNALLASLSDDTMFKRVIDIRQRKPNKHMSTEEKSNLMKLQQLYALKKSQEEIEFEAMDLAEKQAYIKQKMAERGE